MSAQHPDRATLMEVASEHASVALRDAVLEHAQSCAACAQRLTGLQDVLRSAQAAPPMLEGDHHAAKARLLSALPAQAGAAVAPRWQLPGRGFGTTKIAAGLAVLVLSGGALALGITAAADGWFERPPAAALAGMDSRTEDATKAEEPAAAPLVVAPLTTAPPEQPALESAGRAAGKALRTPFEIPRKSPSKVAPRAKQRVETDRASTSTPALPAVKIAPPAKAPVDPKAMPSEEPHRKVAIAEGAKTVLDVAKATERKAKKAAVGAPEWIGVGDLYAQAGEAERAGHAYLEALKGAGAKTARQRLTQVAAADPSAARTLLAKMRSERAQNSAAEALRLRCEWGLRMHADRPAVLDCRSFGQRHPEHPAMRTLALAAGETAERRLSDCRLAIGEYSRALLLGKTSGMATAGALVARARCREQVGEAEEARADLKLYLVMRPAGAYDDSVRRLAERLGAVDLIQAATAEPLATGASD